MKRPFVLADFTRIIWHSEAARAVWAPRIAKINQVWGEVEREAVVAGVRDGCLTFVNPQDLPTVSLWAAARGLVVLPLATNGVVSQYSATASALVAGEPFQYRIVLTRPELAAKWAKAWAGELDNRVTGMLLGYPLCCINFFERVWVEEQGVDTTWEMAQASLKDPLGLSNIHLPADSTPPEANILLRWLGVRLVPHLPCSFACENTVDSASKYAHLIEDRDPQVLDWIYEMLNWPIEWSALHGIAEIRTPVLTISTRTNATGKKLVVQRDGSNYPEEGSKGLRFPFQIVSGKVTSKPSFKRSVTPVYELNGFGSEAAMNTAHDALLAALPAETGFLLDLGCGNGHFLERAQTLGWTVAGVEQDNTRAGAAKIPIRRGNLFDVNLWDGQFDVIAFMPGRLVEDTDDWGTENLRLALKARTKTVLLYAYGDWLEKHGGLGPLVSAAGMGSHEVVKVVRAEGVEAALVVFTQQESYARKEESAGSL
jgi:2-polyprenyl-3-methyl-5-hydroxy-6-metoxy-1,4-benzoquinol methylase